MLCQDFVLSLYVGLCMYARCTIFKWFQFVFITMRAKYLVLFETMRWIQKFICKFKIELCSFLTFVLWIIYVWKLRNFKLCANNICCSINCCKIFSSIQNFHAKRKWSLWFDRKPCMHISTSIKHSSILLGFDIWIIREPCMVNGWRSTYGITMKYS